MGTCWVCGESVATGDAFCGGCGSSLGPPAPAAAGAPPPPPPPPVSPPSSGRGQVPIGAVVAIAGFLVVVALGLLLTAGGDDGPGTAVGAGAEGADDDGPSRLEELAQPELTDEEFVVDMLALGAVGYVGATEAEHECDLRAIVAAMGGADALRDAGISPESLAAPFGLRGEEVPPDAPARYLEVARTCGLDLTEVQLVRPLAADRGPDVARCVGAAIDRAYFDDVLARYWLDPARSSNTLHLPNAAAVAYGALVRGCS